MIHELKTLPQYFQDVRKGWKPFEVRKYDREFRVGDILVLKEWSGEEFTGEVECVSVTYMLSDSKYVKDEHVILGIERIK